MSPQGGEDIEMSPLSLTYNSNFSLYPILEKREGI